MFALKADPRFLGIFRALYGAIGVVFALSAFKYMPYLWHHAGGVNDGYLALHYAWPLLALLICFGLGGRWVLGIHFVVAGLILDNEFSGPGIEETLYLVLGFWLFFMKDRSAYSLLYFIKNKPLEHVDSPGWPVLLLGINVGLIIFIAGVAKLFDPVWIDGLGYYFFHLTPRVRNLEWFDFLIQSQFVAKMINYSAMVLEISCVFLFLIPKTRKIAWAGILFFFLVLTVPFSLGFIGLFGIILCVGLYSVLEKREGTVELSMGERRFAYGVTGAMFFFAINTLSSYQLEFPRMIYPLAFENADGEVVRKTYRPSLLDQSLGAFKLTQPLVKGLYYVNDKVFKLRRNNVFNANHTHGIYQYRVVLETEDETLEPIVYFNADRTRGREYSLLSPVWPQAGIYAMSSFLHRLRVNGSGVLHGNYHLMGQFLLAMSRAPSDFYRKMKKVVLLTSPLILPQSFEGVAKPWTQHPWRRTIEFDLDAKEYRLLAEPEAHPVGYPVSSFGERGRIVVKP